MKGLSSLSNIQRARLLFDLFPAESGDFVTFNFEIADKIVKERDNLKNSLSEGQVFPAAYWVSLAEVMLKKIKSSEGKLAKSGALFSEQLFTGDGAFFSKHCLTLFTNNAKLKTPKFKLAVELLFVENT